MEKNNDFFFVLSCLEEWDKQKPLPTSAPSEFVIAYETSSWGRTEIWTRPEHKARSLALPIICTLVPIRRHWCTLGPLICCSWMGHTDRYTGLRETTPADEVPSSSMPVQLLFLPHLCPTAGGGWSSIFTKLWKSVCHLLCSCSTAERYLLPSIMYFITVNSWTNPWEMLFNSCICIDRVYYTTPNIYGLPQ